MDNINRRRLPQTLLAGFSSFFHILTDFDPSTIFIRPGLWLETDPTITYEYGLYVEYNFLNIEKNGETLVLQSGT